MVLCEGCFDNSPQYDSPSSDTGAIHRISPLRPVSTWQSSAHEQTPLCSKHLPLCQGGGATFLECGAVDEVAFLGKVIVERSVNGRELLQ